MPPGSGRFHRTRNPACARAALSPSRPEAGSPAACGRSPAANRHHEHERGRGTLEAIHSRAAGGDPPPWFPGIAVAVHDSFAARGGQAEGELMRYLAEAACYPTAFLPSQGARGEAVDEHSAWVSLTEADVTVKLLCRFNERALIDIIPMGRSFPELCRAREHDRAAGRGGCVGNADRPEALVARAGDYPRVRYRRHADVSGQSSTSVRRGAGPSAMSSILLAPTGG